MKTQKMMTLKHNSSFRTRVQALRLEIGFRFFSLFFFIDNVSPLEKRVALKTLFKKSSAH